jgi:HD-like signal output (HDOD) protein
MIHMTDLWDQVTRDAQLITLPAVYLRLKAVLDDPDYSVADLEEVISQDPAITARLLRQVNSPYFGFASRIDTVFRAVGLMGSQQVHDMVLATSVAQTFEGISIEIMDMYAFWRQSVYCATAARLLAAECNILDSERLFVAGLLRDIGHLVMYQSIPEQSRQAVIEARQGCHSLYMIERDLIGFDYAALGGALLQQWGLPESLWEPVAMHVTPEQAEDYPLEVAIVHLAAILSEVTDPEIDPESLMVQIHPTAWQLTGLSLEQLLVIQEQVDLQVDDVMELVFPASKAGHAGSRLRILC